MKKYLLLLLLTFQSTAAVINPKGTGEFLLVPYYTVNNNLNTLVSITNTTDRAKALKINFREGLNGHAVLTYNVYLDANDAWTFALAARESTISGNNGQASVVHLTSDLSCAPFLNNSGQEFLPFELVDGQQNLERAREGYIEIIEMAEVSDELAEELDFPDGTDLSDNCSTIANAWSSGFWPNEIGEIATEQMTPVSGGISAEANIIHVGEGINYSIPVTALTDFFPNDTIVHSSPGDTSLSFDAAKPEATIITDKGPMQLVFESGTDATSALFMTNELVASFDVLSAVAAQSELVYVQPTRRFYLNDDNTSAQSPFPDTDPAANCTNDVYGGTQLALKIFDLEGNQINEDNSTTLPAVPLADGICGSVFVHSFGKELSSVGSLSVLTGSNNFNKIQVNTSESFSESGYIKAQFIGARTISATTTNDATVQIVGLPVLGLSLQKYTNANAAPSLMAQYGGVQIAKATTRIIQD